jgi:hypothetical protein
MCPHCSATTYDCDIVLKGVPHFSECKEVTLGRLIRRVNALEMDMERLRMEHEAELNRLYFKICDEILNTL